MGVAVFQSYFMYKIRQQIGPRSLPIFVIDSLHAVTREEGMDLGWANSTVARKSGGNHGK